MRTLLTCALGVILIGFAMWRRPANADDFGPFYRAAGFASAHQSVYARPSWSPRDNAEGRFLPYLRIPSYAAALRPLAALPYPMARRFWIAALVIAAVGSVGLFGGRWKYLALSLAFSFPLADALMIGQDITLVLLLALAAAWFSLNGREFLAGLVASLLSIKPTYLPAAGIVFLAKSRTGALGFLTGTALQIAASFAVSGAAWPNEYLALLRNPLIEPDPGRMLNINALAFAISLPTAVYMAAAVGLYVGFWFIARRCSLADGLLAALPLGLIASPHSRVYDGVVLIPLFVRVAGLDSWTGRMALLGLTPGLYLVALTAPTPFLPISILALIAITMAAGLRLCRTAPSKERQAR